MKEPHQTRTLEELISVYQTGKRFKYITFWGHRQRHQDTIDKSCFSNWYPSPFAIDGIKYHTTEHYMMAQKAKLFDDEAVFNEILEVSSPGEVKNLGRQVRNFSEELWTQKRYDIVFEGNIAKFSQNTALQSFLLSTRKRVIIEASPVDKIWGVGLAGDDKRIANPELWQGENLLGFVLMDVRETIIQKELMI